MIYWSNNLNDGINNPEFLLFHIFFIKKECALVSYGVNCSQQCEGNCRGYTACYHVTGHCVVGCDPGWTGYLCEKGLFSYHL